MPYNGDIVHNINYDLNELSEEIDKQDTQIVQLLQQRAQFSIA